MESTPADDATRLLSGAALEVAPQLLGAVVRLGDVAVRLTEVEAYLGVGDDPGSHAHRGRTARNSSMFGPAGTVYVYLSYGIHRCVNLVCGPVGEASGLLLRSGEVVEGVDTARSRRTTSRGAVDLARGPGRFGSALGVDLADDGTRLGGGRLSLELPSGPSPVVETGPRVGVAGEGGHESRPWRFWIAGDPTVSVYRSAARRTGRRG
ncbi:DNA-3-methyladenine glycosylase [Frigoribacterium sp. CFBP 13712]|uniref:DNA-3-methyladenine glycosylase n=1 Tax=Frigoribacterium sp. CFBP 13712 TaxID=2775309 RepID=UPI00177DE956|nr:DNA-3-methyladenine glycosylase [Frigoribacterium sp. CFBP 13712]MBD8703330.1 DNA-3-methyladenine glycosylase [Frigoribacterium sp. CFBP 13712]